MLFHPMNDHFQWADASAIQALHDASVAILEKEGVHFNHPEASGIFERHGFKLNGKNILMQEKDILKALETAPAKFSIQARNPDFDIRVGSGSPILITTFGAPNISEVSGDLRPATLDDYRTCCDLVQSSDQLDMGGWLMVQPNDLPVRTAHLDMLLTYMTRCDKPVAGAFGNRIMADDTCEMLGLIFGGREYLMDHPVTLFVVNALTPLQFSREQTDVLITAARHCQPVILSNMALAGSTAPAQLPGLLALINAEILSGLVLSQLISPGTPVVYGTTSAPMDMISTIGVLGAWETVKISAIALQLARFYSIPCRTGGSLTDAQVPDGQAGAEGTLLISTSLRNGVDVILHACGQAASFMGLSFEKWLIDEEICRLVKHTLAPLEINDQTIDVDTICRVGSGGQFLTHPSTLRHCRSLSRSRLFNRRNNAGWKAKGAKDCARAAASSFQTRLERHRIPPIDPGLEEELRQYVARRKANPGR